KKFVDEKLNVSISGKFKLLEFILRNALKDVVKEISKQRKKIKANSQTNGTDSKMEEALKDYEIEKRTKSSYNSDFMRGDIVGETTRNAEDETEINKRYTKVSCPVSSRVSYDNKAKLQ